MKLSVTHEGTLYEYVECPRLDKTIEVDEVNGCIKCKYCTVVDYDYVLCRWTVTKQLIEDKEIIIDSHGN